MGNLYVAFPLVRFVLLPRSSGLGPECPRSWQVQCQHCNTNPLFPAGPGQSLRHFIDHLISTHRHLRSAAASEGGMRAGTGDRERNSGRPVVERFLAEYGLRADIAPALEAVGIIDEARMQSLGRLSDEALDKLERGLAEQGLDLAARLLVQEGLRACARQARP
ncbi:hypothetical protein C8Q76DRAFT_727282 [Earliella scabrosa]|nr:hypothetical protein C8Q76DRAFT_727282 [Earliella scabrosa]